VRENKLKQAETSRNMTCRTGPIFFADMKLFPCRWWLLEYLRELMPSGVLCDLMTFED
jgi:hypothetical protein